MGGCAQQQGVLTFSIENDHICVWNHSSMCLLVLCQPVYSLVIMFLQRMKQNSKYFISFDKVQPSQMLNEKGSNYPDVPINFDPSKALSVILWFFRGAWGLCDYFHVCANIHFLILSHLLQSQAGRQFYCCCLTQDQVHLTSRDPFELIW